MSRSAEEQQLVEQRIQAMKQKNEELRRRHLEVEADKQSAAKQNALVKTNAPLDDDWVPGRHIDNPRIDRQQNEDTFVHHEREEDRGQRHEQRRHRNDGQRDDLNNYSQRHFQNPSTRRTDQQGPRQRPDGDRFYGSDNRRTGEYSGRSHDASGSRSKEWVQHDRRGEGGHQSFPSKVFKNSSLESDRSKRPAYRLAEGDGPPPDPSYSFLGDSMRDSPESAERRGQPNRRGFQRGRGRGGQTWNNRNHNEFRRDGFDDRKDAHPTNFEGKKRQSDDAWRRERNLIDQERINRQKTSDGNWSREWDNHKVLQDGDDRSGRWKRGNQTPNHDRSHQRRGFQDDSVHSPKQNYFPRNITSGNLAGHDSAGKVEHDETSRNKFIRRGRFSNQNRFKDNARYNNGSGEQPSTNSSVETSKEAEDTVLIESNVKSVEKLQVSVVVDPMGSQKRCVEGVAGNLLLNMSSDAETSDFSKNIEVKRTRKTPRKVKRNRVLSTTSTGTTTGTAEDDGSWEDLSSDEENVSILAELKRTPHNDLALSKSIDVSSGPESLDPIPAPGKEDEFLWDDFHPAGFQDNATLDLDAEAAYQALLQEQAKQEVVEDSSHPHKVSFKLDTSCLEDSSDELEGAKLDPLLVTTQIVQAEVDCMSLTSIPTDTSLPEDPSQLVRIVNLKDEKIPEEGRSTVCDLVSHEKTLSAEELSGPVSILDIPSSVKDEKQDGTEDIEKSHVETASLTKVEDILKTGNESVSQTDIKSDVKTTPNVEQCHKDTHERETFQNPVEETNTAECMSSANTFESTEKQCKENDVSREGEGIQTISSALEVNETKVEEQSLSIKEKASDQKSVEKRNEMIESCEAAQETDSSTIDLTPPEADITASTTSTSTAISKSELTGSDQSTACGSE